MKPTLLDNKVSGSLNQQLWADVFFSRNIESIKQLDDEKILKLSFFAFLHYNPDITIFFLSEYDLRNGTNLKGSFLDSTN
jgi:hypothetical protein